eukprot:5963486-Prymnesium_polylepis.1
MASRITFSSPDAAAAKQSVRTDDLNGERLGTGKHQRNAERPSGRQGLRQLRFRSRCASFGNSLASVLNASWPSVRHVVFRIASRVDRCRTPKKKARSHSAVPGVERCWMMLTLCTVDAAPPKSFCSPFRPCPEACEAASSRPEMPESPDLSDLSPTEWASSSGCGRLCLPLPGRGGDMSLRLPIVAKSVFPRDMTISSGGDDFGAGGDDVSTPCDREASDMALRGDFCGSTGGGAASGRSALGDADPEAAPLSKVRPAPAAVPSSFDGSATSMLRRRIAYAPTPTMELARRSVFHAESLFSTSSSP